MAEPELKKSESRAGAFTLRAAVVGILCVLGITIAGCFSAFSRYDLIGTGHLPRCALYPVVVIVGLNLLLRKGLAKRGLSRAEMLLIYCTILVMTGIPGQQFALYLYLGLVGPIYYATPQNQYADSAHGFHKYISDWLVPSKDPNDPVIRWMFEGMPQGAGFTDIPWHLWVRPLLVWTPFALLIFFVTLCIASLLRKQWVERERLHFPLAQVPLEVSKTDSHGKPGPIFKSKAFWIGFSIPAFVYILNGLHAYFPAVPEINLYTNWSQNLFSEKPWYVLNMLLVHVYFGMIGIAFLLTTEVSFSFWFFYLFDLIQQMVRISIGSERRWEFRRDQHVGAFLTILLFYAFIARKHLWDVVRKAFTKAPDVDDSGEFIGYRMAFFGAAGGFIGICLWCSMFGLSLIYPAIMFGWYFLSLIVVTRIVAEAGLFVYWLGIGPADFTMRLVGYDNISPQNATLLQFTGFQIFDSATSMMPQGLQAMKIGTEGGVNRRRMFGLLLAAVLIAVVACHVPSLWATYKTGVPNLGWVTRQIARWPGANIEQALASSEGFNSGDYSEMMFGAGFTFFLLFMRSRFLWWPFHPLGYVANTSWMFWRYWFSIFVGWLAKVLVTWLGGVRLYKKVYPAAIGLIVGETFMLFTWLLIHFVYPIEGVLIME